MFSAKTYSTKLLASSILFIFVFGIFFREQTQNFSCTCTTTVISIWLLLANAVYRYKPHLPICTMKLFCYSDMFTRLYTNIQAIQKVDVRFEYLSTIGY